MKNAPRSKFLHCFRPVVDMDMDMDMDMDIQPKGVKTVEKKEDMKTPLTKSMSLDRGLSINHSDNSEMPHRKNRTFSGAIKAVVFEIILAKRVRDGKAYRQDSFGSKPSCSLDLGSDELVNTRETKTNSELLDSSPSSASSSSSCSSSSKNSLSDSTKQELRTHDEDPAVKSNNSKRIEMGSSGFNSGMHLLLISLAITVLWGRLCAILFTSMWLYFLPRRSACNRHQPEMVTRKWSEAECRDNKKRVIMEGLIERNHHCRDRGGH